HSTEQKNGSLCHSAPQAIIILSSFGIRQLPSLALNQRHTSLALNVFNSSCVVSGLELFRWKFWRENCQRKMPGGSLASRPRPNSSQQPTRGRSLARRFRASLCATLRVALPECEGRARLSERTLAAPELEFT